MMIDARTQFCAGTPLNTGAVGSYPLGNVMDLKKSGLDVGHGGSLYLVIQMVTAATSGGGATATFTLASDSTATLATDGTASAHFSTGPIALAKMTAGAVLAVIEVPASSYERYLGLIQTSGTAAFTGGTVNAFLTLDPPKWKAYPDAL